VVYEVVMCNDPASSADRAALVFLCDLLQRQGGSMSRKLGSLAPKSRRTIYGVELPEAHGL
jgi:hypothetical protein